MALKIPDIIICNAVNLLLRAIREDYNARILANQENRSMLYLLFNGTTLGTYNFYENAKSLIVTTPQNPRHVECKLAFDSGDAKYPQIYITLPAESDRNNSVGFGEGNFPEIIFTDIDAGTTEYKRTYSRRWNATYNVVVISDNKNEANILFHLVKSMMVIGQMHLQAKGLENLKIGGSDLTFKDRIPDRTFVKSITLNFEYEDVIPELSINDVISKMLLYWRMEGAEEFNGPIQIPESGWSESGS
jgi:hypothetical protein